MDVQILSLCDFAEDFGGKMCITGTFDTLRVVDFGRNLSSFTIAARVAFDQGEFGRQDFVFAIRDEEGKDLVQPMRGSFEIRERHSFLGASNIVLTLNGLAFPRPGIWFVSLSINGNHLKSIPFKVELAKPSA
ncbi:MAG TPA: hypothetical protein VMV83_13050 [Rectinemataceae bacterium]|nr:hypothetical protein [Rectinemataceae bacterium]